MTMTQPRFRVAICGAGIAGLILAITIGKYDPSIPIDLYEAHDAIGTIGVGITLWKQIRQVFIELGLFEDLKHLLANSESGHGRPQHKTIGHTPGRVSLVYESRRTEGPFSMHRQQMISILEKHIPTSCTIHLEKRLVDYTEIDRHDVGSIPPIRLQFADGTTATTDILIGADGIRSAVRKTLFEKAVARDDETDLRGFIDARFTGMLSYRFLVSAESLRKVNPENRSLKELTLYCGKGRYIITYPIAQGTLLNVLAVISDPKLTGTRYEGRWVADTTSDEVVGKFDDFEPDLKDVIKLCENPSKWALHDLKPLPFCVRERIALIGDACHAMTPYYGAGAGQAIDDAFVLGRLIAHPLTTLPRVPDALRVYQETRLSFAQKVASISLSAGWMYVFMEPTYYDGTRKEEDTDESGIGTYERDGIEVMKQEFSRRWEWIDSSPSGVEIWNKAELKLQALVDGSM